MRAKLVWVIVPVVLIIGAAGYFYWIVLTGSRLPDGIAQANGRIEAEQVEIATKIAGRLTQVLVSEGDMVQQGDVIARLDDAQIAAQLREANAEVALARQAEIQARALCAQRQSELALARKELDRALFLNREGTFPTEGLEQRRSQLEVAAAAVNSAAASLEQAKAAIAATQAKVAEASSALADTVLVAPRAGRIEYLLARSGEVLGPGGRVATLLDLTDVYMIVFLPARDAGRLEIGADARLVLDPIPQYTIPAKVTFVAPEAQFTPKSVETADERSDLMFRVKLQISPQLLERYVRQVKTGVRGVAYVRLRPDVSWPPSLEMKLP